MTTEQAAQLIGLVADLKNFIADATSFALGVLVALIIAITWK